MRSVMRNKVTNALAVMPVDGNCGVKGNALLDSPNIEVIEVTDQKADHVNQNHCIGTDGNIVLLPEEEWPENIVEEDEESE